MAETRVPGASRTVSSRLQNLVDGLADRRDLPHALVMVESGDRAFRWVGAAGDARPGGPAMTEDTPYLIASIDKLYVAAVVMMLHEEQRLDIDDRLIDHLPAPLTQGLHQLNGTDHTPEIRLSHLLGHTSGLPDGFEEAPRGERAFIDQLIADGDRAWTLADDVDRSRGIRPHFPPQSWSAARPRIRYSSTNFVLLMLVLEEIVGAPIHTVLHDRLFAPLGMDRTYMPGRTTPAAEVLAPAALWVGERVLDLPLVMRSLPAIYGTVADGVTFLRALMEGRLFREPGTLTLMWRRWLRFRFPLDRAALRAPSWPIEYGSGIMRFQTLPYLPPFGHRPAVVGHTGSTGTWLFYSSDLDLYMAGTVDQVTSGPLPYRIVPKLLDICAGLDRAQAARARVQP